MPAPTGADERRIRQLLVQRGVGPDAPATAPEHTRPRPADDSWWDRIYDGRGADTHAPTVPTVPDRARVTTDRLPDWRKGETTNLTADPDPDTDPEEEPGPHTDDAGDPDRPDDDPEWADATDPDDPVERAPGRPTATIRTAARRATTVQLNLPRRTRWFASTGAGAALGYGLGLVPLMQDWISSCGTDTGNATAPVALAVGMVAAGAAVVWRTRPWWPPLAWACRIPYASALLALALYAPGVTS